MDILDVFSCSKVHVPQIHEFFAYQHEYFSIGKSSTNLVVLPLLSYPCSHRVFEEGLPLLAVRNSRLMNYDKTDLFIPFI